MRWEYKSIPKAQKGKYGANLNATQENEGKRTKGNLPLSADQKDRPRKRTDRRTERQHNGRYTKA